MTRLLPLALCLLVMGCFASGEDIEKCQCFSDQLGRPIYSVNYWGHCRLDPSITIYDTRQCTPQAQEVAR